MQVQAVWNLAIKLAQKLQIFLMAMTRHTLANDRAIEHIQSRKQSRRTVPFVVVREGAATTFLQGQTRLRSFQSLNLALLINAQHQGFIGGIQVQTHHIVEFFDEPFIFGELEGALSMRLQPIGIPNSLHRRRTDPLQLGHGAHTPMSRRFGSGMQRSFHDFLNLSRRDLLRATAARRISNQRCRSSLQKTVAPQNHRGPTGARAILYPIGEAQGTRNVLGEDGSATQDITYDPYGNVLSDTGNSSSLTFFPYQWNGGHVLEGLGWSH